jgi:hypothetical protein
LGDVLQLAGESVQAANEFREALNLYESKGNLVGVDQMRALREAVVAL